MNNSTNPHIQLTNPFHYKEKIDVILFAHDLIGTVRGKSANGLMIHNKIFNVVAIIDQMAINKKTSEVCLGVDYDVPIYNNIKNALKNHKAKALIILIAPEPMWYSEIEIGIYSKLDIINTSFLFLNKKTRFNKLSKNYNIDIYDLRDVTKIMAYPNVDILKRKSKVIYVTGTDCGLGKRVATIELAKEARKRGVNSVVYATGQTGLMLGEIGTVVDSLTIEFSNGVVSQHICQLSNMGYELIFVEGQSDIFHPANSAVAIALLHGANPDNIVIVHDENRKFHKGFDENSELYGMHSLERYIKTLELLSLPCGPTYKTVGIATIGEKNINAIKSFIDLPVADVRLENGSNIILNAILECC
jgi:uncharacterized NAD-dependent epimerase/dehydratase family protein